MIRFEREGRTLVAVSHVRVGLRELSLTVPLGPWEGPEPEPSGLGGRPVVVVHDPSLVGLAAAGALRSGRREAEVVEGAAELGAGLLRASADVVVVAADDGGVLDVARALGGRPLPALPFPDEEAIARFLVGSEVDLDLAIPSLEPARTKAREVVVRMGLEAMHHVVEVDPRPAFASGSDAGAAPVPDLTAAAAGVLAGRVAAANRRWRGAT